MKRLSIVLCPVALLVSITACRGDATGPSNPETGTVVADSLGKGGGWGGSGHLRGDVTTNPPPAVSGGWGGSGH